MSLLLFSITDSSKTMSPKLARPTQVGVRRPSSSTASPPTVHSPRKAAVSKQVVNVAQTTAISRQSSEDDDDDGEEFNEEKLRTIRDKAAIKWVDIIIDENSNTNSISFQNATEPEHTRYRYQFR